MKNAFACAMQSATEQLSLLRSKQKRDYDQNAQDHKFKIGRRVFLRNFADLLTNAEPNLPTKFGPAHKFAPRWLGPFRVNSIDRHNTDLSLIDPTSVCPDRKGRSFSVSVSHLKSCPSELPSDTKPTLSWYRTFDAAGRLLLKDGKQWEAP